MTRDELAAALAACGYVCVECFSDQVRLDYAPAIGHIPVIIHWPVADGEWCPALSGGAAARLASLDLLDALAAVISVADYGNPEAWHRRSVAAALWTSPRKISNRC
jgi:hypothetical protein